MATSLIDFNALRPNAAMEAYQQGQQNQLAQMQLAQQQQAIQDAEAERQAWKGASGYNEVQQRLMAQGLGKQALAVGAAQAKAQADKIALLKGTTELMKNTATRIMANPELAVPLVTQFGQQTGTDVTRDLATLQSFGNNPEAIKQWAAGHAVNADKLLPKFETFQTPGGGREIGTTNPLTGAYTSSKTMAPQMTPYERAHLAQSGATGNWSPESIDLAANTYLTTGTMPPVGQGAAAMAVRDKIMARAVQLQSNPSGIPVPGATPTPANPKDAAAVIANAKVDQATRAKSQRDFATGIQGQQVTAFNTAVDHLATMDELVTALNNNDTRAINTIGNAIAKQTGQPAPTNFDTARKVVGAEVQKAIIRAGGTGKEREEAAAAFDSASSPDQLRGAIKTYKDLMGGQLKSLQLQYEQTTGRKDFGNRLTERAKQVSGIGGNNPAAGNIPQGAIDYLKANPALKAQFDAKYGAGAADRALGGK